jgi:hypothetical protein
MTPSIPRRAITQLKAVFRSQAVVCTAGSCTENGTMMIT